MVTGFWEVVDRQYQGRWQHLGDPAFDAYETAQLEHAVAVLSSGGAKVALFTSPYFRTGEQPNGDPWPQDDPARVDRLNQLIDQVAGRHPGVVSVVPLNRFLDPAGHFTWTLDGHVARQGDGVHTTLAGGTYLAPRVLPLLAAGPVALSRPGPPDDRSVALVSKTNYNWGHDVDPPQRRHRSRPSAAVPGVGEVDPAEAELAARLRMAVTRLHRRLRQQAAGGLTPSQASALVGVEHLGSPTLGALAARESVQPPTMTKVVGALEELGYVTRVTDPSDRRVARLTITPAGSRDAPDRPVAQDGVPGRPRPPPGSRRPRRARPPDRPARAAGRHGRAVSAVRAAARQTFSSLRVRNFRLYFTAQLISVSGTWMQAVAQAWLVLHLTGSGVALGIVVGLQFLPMLLLGPFGGLVADRVDKRTLLFVTQSAGGLLALALGVLVVTDTVVLWQVYLLAGLLGVVNLFDNPARQTFMIEMVGRDDLPNAVSLNAALMNGSRIVGPAIGGVIITVFGLGVCFFVNAASYVAVIVGLAMMRTAELRPTEPVARAKGQVREGFRYVWATPALRNVLLSVALIGIFAYNFTVTLALLAKVTFDGGAGAYAGLTACMGAGAVVGGLIAAHRAKPTPRLLQVLALVFGGLLAAVALAPTLLAADLLIVLMGAASIGFIATANATLQLTADPAMRGRVMALYAMAFLGTTPIGAPLVGAIAQWTNPRVALLTGAVATVVSAGLLMWRHQARLRTDEGADDARIHLVEVRAVEETESETRVG